MSFAEFGGVVGGLTTITDSQDEYSQDTDNTTALTVITDIPLLIGYVCSSILLGIMFLQTFIYFMTFPADRKQIKWLVGTMFSLEVASSILFLIAGVGSLPEGHELLSVRYLWALRATGPICGIVASLAHGFYAWRIYYLIKSLWLPIIICFMSIIQAGMVSVSAIKFTLQAGSLTLEQPKYLFINILWLGGGAFVDILIALTFIVIFTREARSLEATHGKRGTLKYTIHRIMVLCIDTAAITAAGALLELGLFLSFRNTFIHFTVYYILPRLYANCVLAVLNARILLPIPTPYAGQAVSNAEVFYQDTSRRKTIPPTPLLPQFSIFTEGDGKSTERVDRINDRLRYTANLQSRKSYRKSFGTHSHFQIVRARSHRKRVLPTFIGPFDWESPKSPESAFGMV